MLEILTIVVFVWLMVKAVGLCLKLTWGLAKMIAGILMVIALPVLVICIAFVGGIALLLPIVLIGTAVAVLKACV